MVHRVALFVCFLASTAHAQESTPSPAPKSPSWTVSGTLSTDFSALRAAPHHRDTNPEEGFTGEYSLGGSYSPTPGINVSLRTCVGCHEFTLHEAYADIDLTPQWSLRAGRMPIPFGGASRRTNPAHYEGSTRPLPYIMGNMVRGDWFNNGILPAPAVDNGAAVQGSFWIGASRLASEVSLSRGLIGSGPDLDFKISRDFEDTNGQPMLSTRHTLAVPGLATISASYLFGNYDADADLAVEMGAADLEIPLAGWTLRLEGVFRRTEFLEPGGGEGDSRRTGFVVRIDGSLDPEWRVFAMADGLTVDKLFLTTAGPFAFPVAGSTDDSNEIRRYSGGAAWHQRPGLIYKGSAEFWDFSDFRDTWVFHVSVVVSF